MFDNATPDYINFIKKFLIKRFYEKYVNFISVMSKDDDDQEYNNNLICNITNETLWNGIFNLEYNIFNYYLALLNTVEKDIINKPQLIIYQQETFQDYIDRTININNIGTYDYQQFISNMKEEPFHSHMVEKYNKDQRIRQLKNQMVYIIQLYIKKTINPSVFMTEEEKYEIDACLDMMPYFNYMTKNKWVDHIQCYEEEYDKNSYTNSKLLKKYEKESIKIIGESLM